MTSIVVGRYMDMYHTIDKVDKWIYAITIDIDSITVGIGSKKSSQKTIKRFLGR